jgi:DNA helicase-2/ATP-dependent DNA helicase PcrA
VVDRIKEFYDQGMELSHQCVLFRSSYITIPLQAELGRRNIPFAVYGGMKFYETAHVKDLIAHLKLFVNPKDELAWSRVLLLVPGIGPKTAERMLGEMVSCETLRPCANVIEPTGTVLGGLPPALPSCRLLESDGRGRKTW